MIRIEDIEKPEITINDLEQRAGEMMPVDQDLPESVIERSAEDQQAVDTNDLNQRFTGMERAENAVEYDEIEILRQGGLIYEDEPLNLDPLPIPPLGEGEVNIEGIDPEDETQVMAAAADAMGYGVESFGKPDSEFNYGAESTKSFARGLFGLVGGWGVAASELDSFIKTGTANVVAYLTALGVKDEDGDFEQTVETIRGPLVDKIETEREVVRQGFLMVNGVLAPDPNKKLDWYDPRLAVRYGPGGFVDLAGWVFSAPSMIATLGANGYAESVAKTGDQRSALAYGMIHSAMLAAGFRVLNATGPKAKQAFSDLLLGTTVDKSGNIVVSSLARRSINALYGPAAAGFAFGAGGVMTDASRNYVDQVALEGIYGASIQKSFEDSLDNVASHAGFGAAFGMMPLVGARSQYRNWLKTHNHAVEIQIQRLRKRQGFRNLSPEEQMRAIGRVRIEMLQQGSVPAAARIAALADEARNATTMTNSALVANRNRLAEQVRNKHRRNQDSRIEEVQLRHFDREIRRRGIDTSARPEPRVKPEAEVTSPEVPKPVAESPAPPAPGTPPPEPVIGRPATLTTDPVAPPRPTNNQARVRELDKSLNGNDVKGLKDLPAAEPLPTVGADFTRSAYKAAEREYNKLVTRAQKQDLHPEIAEQIEAVLGKGAVTSRVSTANLRELERARDLLKKLPGDAQRRLGLDRLEAEIARNTRANRFESKGKKDDELPALFQDLQSANRTLDDALRLQDDLLKARTTRDTRLRRKADKKAEKEAKSSQYKTDKSEARPGPTVLRRTAEDGRTLGPRVREVGGPDGTLHTFTQDMLRDTARAQGTLREVDQVIEQAFLNVGVRTNAQRNAIGASSNPSQIVRNVPFRGHAKGKKKGQVGGEIEFMISELELVHTYMLLHDPSTLGRIAAGQPISFVRPAANVGSESVATMVLTADDVSNIFRLMKARSNRVGEPDLIALADELMVVHSRNGPMKGVQDRSGQRLYLDDLGLTYVPRRVVREKGTTDNFTSNTSVIQSVEKGAPTNVDARVFNARDPGVITAPIRVGNAAEELRAAAAGQVVAELNPYAVFIQRQLNAGRPIHTALQRSPHATLPEHIQNAFAYDVANMLRRRIGDPNIFDSFLQLAREYSYYGYLAFKGSTALLQSTSYHQMYGSGYGRIPTRYKNAVRGKIGLPDAVMAFGPSQRAAYARIMAVGDPALKNRLQASIDETVMGGMQQSRMAVRGRSRGLLHRITDLGQMPMSHMDRTTIIAGFQSTERWVLDDFMSLARSGNGKMPKASSRSSTGFDEMPQFEALARDMRARGLMTPEGVLTKAGKKEIKNHPAFQRVVGERYRPAWTETQPSNTGMTTTGWMSRTRTGKANLFAIIEPFQGWVSKAYSDLRSGNVRGVAQAILFGQIIREGFVQFYGRVMDARPEEELDLGSAGGRILVGAASDAAGIAAPPVVDIAARQGVRSASIEGVEMSGMVYPDEIPQFRNFRTPGTALGNELYEVTDLVENLSDPTTKEGAIETARMASLLGRVLGGPRWREQFKVIIALDALQNRAFPKEKSGTVKGPTMGDLQDEIRKVQDGDVDDLLEEFYGLPKGSLKDGDIGNLIDQSFQD